jgi:hypothetical protein
MFVFRRTPRAVYRVYSEEAYLAGANALDEWPVSPSRDAPGGRRLRRLSGAAALTGAVGTVGGVIVIVGVGVRSADQRVAVSGTSRTRAVLPHTGQTGRSEAVEVRLVNGPHGALRVRAVAARPGGSRSSDRIHRIPAGAVRPASSRWMSASARTAPADLVGNKPAAVGRPSPRVSDEVREESPIHSEFGFER